MIDIEFYMKAFDLKYRLMNGERMPRGSFAAAV